METIFKLLPEDAVLPTDLVRQHSAQFQKEKTALKYYLVGKGFSVALKALGFAERHHAGFRKDNVTPELHHQVRIAMSAMHLKGLADEETVIALALLHDVQEDYEIPREVIAAHFGEALAAKEWKLTKKFAGEHKDKDDYVLDLSKDQDCSVVKGLDRIDNLEHMIGVFTDEKIFQYSREAEQVFLPMVKAASKLYPEQGSAYHVIRKTMRMQLQFLDAYLKRGSHIRAISPAA